MEPHLEPRLLTALASQLVASNSVLFITGAGLSADSNLPTYRGIGGLYEDKMTQDGIPIEVALSGSMIHHQPQITWKYIHRIEAACRGAKPNRGHEVIAEMERHFDRLWVLTQNVDGFHHRSGSKNVIDIHGDIHDLICTQCDHHARVMDYSGVAERPTCPKCHGLVRPDVVLFGEMLPAPKVETLHHQLALGFDMVISVGTSSLFPYIVQPILDAKSRGKSTVEINPGQTDISSLVDFKVSHGAAMALDAIWDRVKQLRSGGP